MRTVSFQSVLWWIARKMLGAVELMQDEDAASYTDSINTALRDCWERDAWPEWTAVEERYFRPRWDIGTEYQAGDEVYYPDACPPEGQPAVVYWRSLFNLQFGHVPGEDGFWERTGVAGVTPIDPYISLDQPGMTPIGTVFRVSPLDPRLFPGTHRMRYSFSKDGIQIPDTSLKSVWVQFRLRPPVFTSVPYSEMQAYAVGQSVYDPVSGNCVTAAAAVGTNLAPAGHPELWTVIPFPYVLAECVKKFAYAEALRDDGQEDKADINTEAAEELLSNEWGKADGQQNQVRNFNVQVRGADDFHRYAVVPRFTR